METAKEEQAVSLGKVLVFRAEKAFWACQLQQVKEIVRASSITPLPNSTDKVIGIINVRGDVIPVVDLWSNSPTPLPDQGQKKMVIIVKEGEDCIGICVEKVLAIEDIHAFDLGDSVSQGKVPHSDIVSCSVYLSNSGFTPLVDVGLAMETIRAQGYSNSQHQIDNKHVSSAGGI